MLAAAAAGALILTGLTVAPAQASHPEVSLPNSNFEIDTNANLKVDDAAPSIDWLSVADVPKADAASGSGDDSYKGGQKEDTQNPKLETGSIPPNKSDLKTFSTYLETVGNQKFLHMFWHRVQDPSGTTNMDFEFNQLQTLSDNGVTPDRAAGDLLIQYDLANGGTNPLLFLSTWILSAADGACESGNTFPCWSEKEDLSGQGLATGSINTSAIPAADTGGLGGMSARTFGEATVDFTSFFDPTKCVSFGSAHLKSRSSDSFDSALKDFIAPAPTNIDNCAKVIIRKQTDPDENPNTTDFGYTKSFATDPATSNTFTLKDDGVFENSNVLLGTGLTVVEDVIPQGWDFVNVNCGASSGVIPSISGALVTFTLDNPDDVLDCTYTNRARGTIIVEKITNDGFGPFDFTSGTLPDTAFTLTTTAAGAAGKDSETFGDLIPGTFDVSETVPASWNLVSETCNDGSDPQSISLSAGETVTCTFVNEREKGSIKIVKTRKHAASGPGDHPHAGVTFTVTGGNLSQGIVVQTNAQGIACVPNLVVSALVGNYTVTETVPTGYVALSTNPQTASVSEATSATCADTNAGAIKTFENMPLTDITVSVNSQVDGGTASTIDCTPLSGVSDDATTGANGDGSHTVPNLQPGTYVCEVFIDP